MKSEERHHLKENDLQNLLVKTKPFLEKNLSMIVAVGLAIVIAAVVWLWMHRPPSSETASAASGMLTAYTQQDYGSIASDSRYKDTQIGYWASVKEADALLANGVILMFSDRAGAVSDLKQALENYNLILEKSSDKELRELSLYGKGCTLEALCDGDTTEAVETFEIFVNEFGETSVYTPDAVRRAQRLKKPNVQAMYKWMAENAGKPIAEQRPLDGMLNNPLEGLLSPGGSVPGATVPGATVPDASAPTGPQMTPQSPAKAETATPEEPASEDSTPAEPVTEDPAAEKPVTEEPATEEPKPAESTPEESASEEAKPAEATETAAETSAEEVPAEPAQPE
ncbi:hypothetical protein Pla110_09140 [Polystyrenella longa]|uniref:Uncharacterized protein n=1 Tax=Polystyrenella longa TaxID=2528007 RepID=A0A518CIZ6_9PLAN|nr:hypothetical protein [Polystyrenella longa]QDU79209.1 hypothetical protein Pla110_09140 [Polystyrenella longa]